MNGHSRRQSHGEGQRGKPPRGEQQEVLVAFQALESLRLPWSLSY